MGRLTYALDDSDVAAVEREPGAGSLISREIVIETGYRDDGGTWELELDEHEIVELLRNGLELPSAPQAKGSTATHVADFVETLRGLEDPNAGAQTVLAKVAAWRTRVST